jgi:hypothetical protein
MRLLFLWFFLLVHLTALAQQQNTFLVVDTAKSVMTLSDLRSKKIARERGLSYQFTDPQTKRSYLLVADETGNWRYRATLNHDAAISTGAAFLQDQDKAFQLTGEDVTCGIWEDGFVNEHIELGNRILSKEGSTPKSHAIHVTGTILAAGNNALAKGMAPKAKAFTYYFNNDEAEMKALSTADATGLLFSNHSYGTVTGWSRPNNVWTWYGDANISTDEDFLHGFYSERSKSLDALAFASPYHTIVWAAGNDRGEPGNGTHPADCNKGTGYDCIIPDAVGKNTITVGAVNKVVSYTSPASVVMSNFSSWGPTDDGRIKPDLVGVGVNVFSLSASGTNTYETMTGTSMATPNVTGSLMLLQQLYGKLAAGKRMKSATVKALAIHTAREAGAKAGPDYQFGWGLLNVEAAANFLLKENGRENRLVETTLHQGETHQISIQPRANKKITITICWTDPEGNPVSNALDPPDRMLINDIDIRLIDEDGISTQPWILNPTVPQAQATQGDNVRDNVEKIELETPLQKTYTLLVRHKGQLKYEKQDYSLAISYTDANESSKVFYWIGNSGEWNDAQHWSLTQGGVAASEIPSGNDLVVFDASSLADGDTVTITENTACARLIWLVDKTTVLNTKGNALTISEQFTTCSSKMSAVGGGTLKFVASVSGAVNFIDNNFSEVDLLFEQGNWTINGSGSVGNVILQQGEHRWAGTTLQANEITLLSPSLWNVTNAQLTITSKITLPANQLLFISVGSSVHAANKYVTIDWGNQDYNGKIYVAENADLTMLGQSKIATTDVDGKLRAQGSFTYDTLRLGLGSELAIQNGKTQTVLSAIEIESSAEKPIRISSETSATLHLALHQKYCFDNLIVSNTDIEGEGVMNAGLNSNVSNSSNWLQMPCEEVLFANFEIQYPCEGAMTQFTDVSTGIPTSWQWDFNDEELPSNTSSSQNPQHVFTSRGDFEVSLTVQNKSQTQTFSKLISIEENTLSANSVVVSTDQLMSLNTASAYQWYIDRETIEDATSRSLTFQQEAGLYEVVTIEGNCNRISTPYLVTGVDDAEQIFSVFPNPADHAFTVDYDKSKYSGTALLKNNLGQTIKSISIEKPVSTHNLTDGLYLIEIEEQTGKRLIQKILVKH